MRQATGYRCGERPPAILQPEGLSEGETFTCTATTADGETIEFLGTMTSDDEFEIVTTNLLVASDIEAIREEGAPGALHRGRHRDPA